MSEPACSRASGDRPSQTSSNGVNDRAEPRDVRDFAAERTASRRGATARRVSRVVQKRVGSRSRRRASDRPTSSVKARKAARGARTAFRFHADAKLA
ncbi:Hypothetical protein A7982_08335 [Minicystis rosea]|nr:Hypothetical protein A7982_08335 [Minicystis rosea]